MRPRIRQEENTWRTEGEGLIMERNITQISMFHHAF